MFEDRAQFVRVHDLLEIDPAGIAGSAPAWVAQELAGCPFVVVRRGLPERDSIPVGVRGQRREDRWPAFCDLGSVTRIWTPAQLLEVPISQARVAAIPAMQTLRLLKARWAGLKLPWGPGGSVGFELATERQTATAESDLDVIVHAHERLSRHEALDLCERAADLTTVVDIRVETPACGFSLKEYASAGGGRILLRNAEGNFLGDDPWAVAMLSCLDGRTAAPSTAPLAVKLREARLRMTNSSAGRTGVETR